MRRFITRVFRFTVFAALLLAAGLVATGAYLLFAMQDMAAVAVAIGAGLFGLGLVLDGELLAVLVSWLRAKRGRSKQESKKRKQKQKKYEKYGLPAVN